MTKQQRAALVGMVLLGSGASVTGCGSGGGGTTPAGAAGQNGGAGVTGSAGTGAGAGTNGSAGTNATGAAGTTASGVAGTTAIGAAGTGAAGAGAAGTGVAGTGTAGASAAGAGGKVVCGTEKPDVSSITGSEGIVIDADGTIYFSQTMAVGRLRPGAASKPDKAWAKLMGASTVWGLAIDRASHALYAGSPTTATIYKVTLEDTPTVTTHVMKAGQPNGLTMGPDGALYYGDFAAMGDVYRVTANGTRTKVTTTPLAMANGLAFGADGALYVDLFTAGSITKLTLAAGVETARADFVAKGLAPAADGLAFDAMGAAYVGYAGGVSRVSADGKMLTNVAKGGSANLEFGAGALDCKDIYYVSGGKLTRATNDIAGAPVPWHLP